MIIDASFQGSQDRRLAVVTAPGYHCDSAPYGHSADFPGMRQISLHTQGIRRPEANSPLQRTLRDPALPGKNRSIRNKCDITILGDEVPQTFLIVGKLYRLLQPFLVYAGIIQGPLYDIRQKCSQPGLCGLPREIPPQSTC